MEILGKPISQYQFFFAHVGVLSLLNLKTHYYTNAPALPPDMREPYTHFFLSFLLLKNIIVLLKNKDVLLNTKNVLLNTKYILLNTKYILLNTKDVLLNIKNVLLK